MQMSPAKFSIYFVVGVLSWFLKPFKHIPSRDNVSLCFLRCVLLHSLWDDC